MTLKKLKIEVVKFFTIQWKKKYFISYNFKVMLKKIIKYPTFLYPMIIGND